MNMRPLVLVLAVAAQGAHAQSLDDRIGSARGTIAFEVITRRNVCGNGVSIFISRDTSPGWTTSRQRNGMHFGRTGVAEDGICEETPARVLLTRSGGTVTDLRVTVGGRETAADTDLGIVKAADAVRYLLTLAPRLTGRSADHAVLGAAIAEGPSVWRQLLAIVRDNDASETSRKASLFWVSQEVSTVVTAGLTDVAMDDASGNAVRSDALFYLSQRRDGEGVPALIRVVRESKSMKLKKDAIFFLSQSRDPRALDLFEKLLAGR